MADTLLHAFYDLNTSPVTFDSVVFMVAANGFAAAEGKDGFVVYIVPSDTEDGFRQVNGRDMFLPLQRKLLRLHRIILPIGSLFPRCAATKVLKSRASFHKIRAGLAPNQFFPPWLDEGKSAYSTAILPWGHKMGWPVQPVVPPEPAMKWARRKKRKGRLAVITLRQSDFQTKRNSNLQEWEKVRGFLEGRGYRVVTVPDTEALLSDHHGPWSGEISEGASVDLLKRAALYEVADLNLMVSGGPATLAMLNPRVRFVVCNMVHAEYDTTRQDWLDRIGFIFGRDPEWFQPHQHILWTPDTFETLRPEIEKLML